MPPCHSASSPAPLAAPPGAAPRHVAIIMDGNRRWAQARGLPVALGHKAGAEAARRTIEAAVEQGVGWLTLFAFSSENWRRPARGGAALTGLLRLYLRSEVASLARGGRAAARHRRARAASAPDIVREHANAPRRRPRAARG